VTAATGPDGRSRLVLVTGGARSGKSRFAEDLAGTLAGGGPVVYVATATPGDAEMAARIARHRARRPATWATLEAPRDLAAALGQAPMGGRAVLVDCLTLWLSNRYLEAPHGLTEAEVDALAGLLVAALRSCPVPVVAVSNEVGWGVVPDHPLGRAFRDGLGLLNQRVAAAADQVFLLVSGLPLTLKGQAGG